MSETFAGAPGRLEVVREFINSIDLESGSDELGTPTRLAEWFLARGLMEPGTRVRASDVARALETREALRTILEAKRTPAEDHPAVELLNRAADRSRLNVRFSPDAFDLEPAASGVAGAIGNILSIVTNAMADGSWGRLKVCGKHSCRWAFYDHSKNRSRTWCAMAVCGNQVKAQTYRERRRAR